MRWRQSALSRSTTAIPPSTVASRWRRQPETLVKQRIKLCRFRPAKSNSKRTKGASQDAEASSFCIKAHKTAEPSECASPQGPRRKCAEKLHMSYMKSIGNIEAKTCFAIKTGRGPSARTLIRFSLCFRCKTFAVCCCLLCIVRQEDKAEQRIMIEQFSQLELVRV